MTTLYKFGKLVPYNKEGHDSMRYRKQQQQQVEKKSKGNSLATNNLVPASAGYVQ